MFDIEEIPKSARELVAEAQTFIQENRTIKEITNNEEYLKANEILREAKFRITTLETEKRKATKKYYDIITDMKQYFQPSQEEYAKIEKGTKNNLNKYEELNRRKRREEFELNKRQAILLEEKIKKELDEKRKDEDIKKAELERKKKEEERKIIAIEENAKKEEVNGNEIKANELKNEAEILRKNDKEMELAIKFQEMKIGSIDIEKEITIVHPEEPKTPEIPKIVGLIRRRRWDFRTIDKELIPDPYVIINKVIDNKKLRHVINQADGQITIPGIEIFEASSIAVYPNK